MRGDRDDPDLAAHHCLLACAQLGWAGGRLITRAANPSSCAEHSLEPLEILLIVAERLPNL